MREKLGRGKGRRGCLSGSYELGRERTGAGTNAASTWSRRGRGGGSGQCMARDKRRGGGPTSGNRAGAIEAASDRRGRGPVCTSRGSDARGPAGFGLLGWLGEKGASQAQEE
jgi:hypothetical protein